MTQVYAVLQHVVDWLLNSCPLSLHARIVELYKTVQTSIMHRILWTV